MKSQLLCTFTNTKALSKTVDKVIQAYDILYNKLFVLKNENDTRELMCTYNIVNREAKNHLINAKNNNIGIIIKSPINTCYLRIIGNKRRP